MKNKNYIIINKEISWDNNSFMFIPHSRKIYTMVSFDKWLYIVDNTKTKINDYIRNIKSNIKDIIYNNFYEKY
jgi:hypothetical protein